MDVPVQIWVTLPPNHPRLLHRSHQLVAPLVQGKNIVAEIESSSPFIIENIHFIREDDNNHIEDTSMTFNHSNILFCQGQYVCEGDVTRFKTRYRSERDDQPVSRPLDIFLSHISAGIRKRYVQPYDGARDIVSNLAATTRTVEGLLEELSFFVGETNNQRPHQQPIHATDLVYFINEYYETGRFSGDCKSVAVFFAGLAQTLGIPARTVGGHLTREKTFLGYHIWPELFLTTGKDQGFWAPYDLGNPGLDTHGAFTSARVRYYAEIDLPHLTAQARLRIRYE